jgi:hypothetical protein
MEKRYLAQVKMDDGRVEDIMVVAESIEERDRYIRNRVLNDYRPKTWKVIEVQEIQRITWRSNPRWH